MKNRAESTIDKKTFFQILENISPNSYIFCDKCNATKIDTPELLKFVAKYVNQHLYCDDDSDYEESFGIMEAILEDIRCWPDDADDDIRWFDKWPEEYDLRYCEYDHVLFYQNVECGCYLKRNIEQGSIYSVRFE